MVKEKSWIVNKKDSLVSHNKMLLNEILNGKEHSADVVYLQEPLGYENKYTSASQMNDVHSFIPFILT